MMCCPPNKVIKSDSKTFSIIAIGGLHEEELCGPLQAMAPTNVKTIHQTSLLHIARNLDQLGLLSPTHGQRSQQQSGQIKLLSVLVDKPKFYKATRHEEISKIVLLRPMAVEALSWRSRHTSQHPAVQSPVHP